MRKQYVAAIAAVVALSACGQQALEESEGQKPDATAVQVVSAPAPNTTAPKASDCPDDGPRLPGSGICQGRGENYLDIKEGTQPMLADNCEWKLNEASMPGGDFLLYLAASCGQHTAKLEFAAGARFAEVFVAKSALSDGQPGSKLITVATIEESDPKGSILLHAQNAMSDQTEVKNCFIAEVGGDGYPSDALSVTSRTPAQEQIEATDGPLSPVCGRFGDPGDSASYWRVFGGYAWFFELGQDGYQDIDPRSLTVVMADDLNK